MNINQITSALRDIVKYVGAGTAGGYILQNWLGIDPSQISAAVAGIGAILALAATIWSQFSGTKAAVVAKAADIIQIPIVEQKKAGVVNPVFVPTKPPAPVVPS